MQHTLTRRYLRGVAEWAIDPTQAWVFKDADDALAICHSFGLEDVEIVVADKESIYQIPVLIEHAAASSRVSKSLSVALPEMN